MASVDTYLDSWRDPDSHRKERADSAQRHLKLLETANESAHPPKSILEVGSGVGGVSLALQQRYPEATITAVDRDAQAKDHADKLHISFILADLLKLSPEESQKLIANNEAIIALRTSGAVVLHLLDLLPKIGYRGRFTFSLIEQTDSAELRIIDEIASRGNHNFHFEKFFFRNYVFLENDRAKNERGYVVEFSPKSIRT